MSAESTLNERSGTAASLRSLNAGGLEGRTKYVIGAICMAIEITDLESNRRPVA